MPYAKLTKRFLCPKCGKKLRQTDIRILSNASVYRRYKCLSNDPEHRFTSTEVLDTIWNENYDLVTRELARITRVKEAALELLRFLASGGNLGDIDRTLLKGFDEGKLQQPEGETYPPNPA